MVFIEGLTLGFTNNLFCAITCAPAILSVFLVQEEKPLIPAVKFIAGRLIAYLIFGALCGVTGVYFEGRVNPRVFSVFIIILSIFLLVFAAGIFKTKFCPAKFLGLAQKNLPLISGVVLGLNICPPFLLGLSRTLAMGNVLLSVIFFAGFYIGSSAWMILFLFMGKLPSSKYLSIAGRILAALAGLWYLRQGIILLFF
jgi:hypothetical protein